tara:strand:- start:791 stop:1678 length:888 start_codon:yes stop_codon:yes gene_type:complete
MAPYGDLKVNNLIYDTGSGDASRTVVSIPQSANPTFTGDVTLTGASYNVVFDASDNALEFADNAVLRLGSDADLDIVHTGATAYIKNTTGTLYIQDDSAVIIGSLTNSHSYVKGVYTGAVELFHNNVKTCETTATGINVTGTAVTDGLTVAGDSSFTGQSDFTGQLKEAVTVTAGKLSDNQNLDIANGNVFLFTTAESTTSTPNLRYNSSTTLDSKMAVGDCLSVTIITTANASAFSAQLKIDGADVTENWTGGSAPSAGGSSGKDIHAYTIIKTGTSGTLANDYTVIANHTKTS